MMQALFIGQTYIDVTFIADRIPTGDDKDVARDYAVSFGGNAVTAAFCCARLGIAPDLLTSVADDWLGRMFLDMAAKYQVCVHTRKVRRSSLSFVMPKEGKRAIVRCRDDDYLHPFPPLNLKGLRALHLDGHQADAAIHYAKACKEAGILTSLDGGGLRVNTMELLPFIDVAIVSERFCEQLHLTPIAVLELLRAKGCGIGGVTMGERGLLWYGEKKEIGVMPALAVPASDVVDTNGAGDVFHGAYIYSHLSRANLAWSAHFEFARAASAHAIRFLGNEARLPTVADVEATMLRYPPVQATVEPTPARASAAQ
jgi:sugar/nucleoside kinase (ribokinase family)